MPPNPKSAVMISVTKSNTLFIIERYGSNWMCRARRPTQSRRAVPICSCEPYLKKTRVAQRTNLKAKLML